MKKEFSSGGVVFKKTDKGPKVLFLLDPYDKWGFPKGHIEGEEEKEEAALREVEEEVGIKAGDLRIVKYLGDIDYWFKFKGETIYKIVYFYLIEARSGVKTKAQRKEGIKDIKWIDLHKAVEFSDYDNVAGILNNAVEYLKNQRL